MTTYTPRTDAASFSSRDLLELMKTSQQLERDFSASKAEVERLKELLNRAISEIEKAPFHAQKLTAFTAHRLAERYRDQMTNNSTESNKNPDSVFNNNITTDTPRTDTCNHCGAFLLTHHTPAYCEERTARKKADAEADRLKGLLSDLLILTEKQYWNSNNYKQIKKAYHENK
jgi:hypothetical protein